MKSGEERRLAVFSSSADIRILAEFTRDAASQVFPADIVNTIEVAIVEAANNICEHSYGLRGGLPIELTIRHTGNEMVFLFHDEGPPFDPSAIKPLKFIWNNIHEVPESGRGIYIINEIMDQVEYNRSDNINLLTLVKKLPEKCKSLPVPFIENKECCEEVIRKLKTEMALNEVAIDEMAEELSSAYESLNLFYSLSKDVALISDLGSFLNNTLEKVLHAAAADWGVVRLVEKNKLVFYSGTDDCPETARKRAISLDSNNSIEGKVTQSLDIELDEHYNKLDVYVLCLPIVGLDAFIGTILIGKSKTSAPFTAGDAKLTRALADQIAVSIENNRLYSKAMDVELAEKEMEIATNLQQKLILERLPSMPALDLYIKSEAAKQVGGDYLTLYKINSNILYFAVCDAMGKGMSASYFSLLSHMALHSIIIQQNMTLMSPGEALTLMNRIMHRDFDLFGMFMTACIGKINIQENSLEYASAGHSQPIYYTPSKGLEILDTLDFMLGVDINTNYMDFKVDFYPETKLLIYSDGLTDITDPSGDMVGIESLAKACEIEFKKSNILDSCEKIYQAVVEVSGQVLQDDISMIGIERVAD
jgi:serine phosphatase RsbU (regulator of sigma subunit)/anti-sigma regulatory factor (Ser/Thr protein kinase)